MDDENGLHEIDRRLTAALSPDDATVRRVIARAVQRERGRTTHRSRRFVAATLVATLAIAAATGWYWAFDRRVRQAPDLTIIGNGSSIVVTNAAGQRWFVHPQPTQSTRGSYVVVVRTQPPSGHEPSVASGDLK